MHSITEFPESCGEPASPLTFKRRKNEMLMTVDCQQDQGSCISATWVTTLNLTRRCQMLDGVWTEDGRNGGVGQGAGMR